MRGPVRARGGLQVHNKFNKSRFGFAALCAFFGRSHCGVTPQGYLGGASTSRGRAPPPPAQNAMPHGWPGGGLKPKCPGGQPARPPPHVQRFQQPHETTITASCGRAGGSFRAPVGCHGDCSLQMACSSAPHSLNTVFCTGRGLWAAAGPPFGSTCTSRRGGECR